MSRPSRSLKRGKGDAVPESRELVTPESPLLSGRACGCCRHPGSSMRDQQCLTRLMTTSRAISIARKFVDVIV